MEGMAYESDRTQLEVGDTLVMYTDGVNEAFNRDLEEYGEPRMEKILGELNGKDCREVIDGQLEDIRKFTDGAEQSDDITIMALKRKA
jgi:sigma-B regulation protein RsbU (phosphoserine phosphatase)